MRLAALLTLALLTGCGIDGPPSKPGATGVSGEARIGVVGTL